MKHWKLLLTTLLMSVVLCGCTKTSNVIVVVNDKQITAADFQREFDKKANNPELKKTGIDLKNKENNPYFLMLKSQVIDEMIVTSLVDAEIEKRKITVSDEDVDNEYKNIINAQGTEEQLKEALKQNNISLDQFKKDLKTELKYRKLIDQIAPIKISDEEAKKFYNQNSKQFDMPERVRASHILVSANKDEIKALLMASEEGKGKTPQEIDALVQKEMNTRLEKAKAILAEVKKDKSKFAQIAKEKSDDKISAAQGGDLGVFTADRMVPQFSKAAFSLRPNTVSEIVTTPYGYHIILVQDKMAAGKETFDTAKENIKKYLEITKKGELIKDYVENLKKSAKIEYKDSSYTQEAIKEEMKKLSTPKPTAGAPVAPQPENAKKDTK